MNPSNLTQSGQSEIYRLLKIGDFTIVPETQTAPPQIEELKAKAQKALVETQSKYKVTLFSQIFKLFKPVAKYLIYPLIFAVSFSIFYFSLNFPSLTAQISSWFNTSSQTQEQLGENLAAYSKWINGYFYAISNRDLLTPTNDIDKDGLTNLDEFVMKTNPTVIDSDSDGTNDGVEILDFTNPWGQGEMTKQQRSLRDQINVNLISDRIGFAASTGSNINAGLTDFDLTRPGELSIPKLNMQVPLIFSKSPDNFDKDLEKGVIHYPGTALPGEKGIVYVSGHSSDFFWKKNEFSTVFAKINRLEAGDDIFVTVYDANGKAQTFRYRVAFNKIYSPDDQTQFIDNSSAKLNLSTCWPIGTSKDRLVVTAELVSL
jgi:LPXTG-site transpeptidase (sortase) family protein